MRGLPMRCILAAALGVALAGFVGTAEAGELYDATLANNLGDVDELVSAGADLEDVGDLGTPLHVAAFHGNAAMVVLLLDKGADIEGAKNSNGFRPLHAAVSYK